MRFQASWLLLIVVAITVAPAQQLTPKRALPLKHFPDSRLNAADGFYRMPTGIGDDYWDGNDSVARVRRHMETARQLGVKYLRCAFSWNGIEHEQGVYKWRFWDQLVAESERAGIRLIPYVAYTPEWAARSRDQYWKQPPRDAALYAAFMEKVAARYRGQILSWELWNEPDIQDYWLGSREEYAELVRQAAVSVRRADPAAVIVLGGMSRGPSEFLQRLLREDRVAEYVDVIAMHAYPESWDPERAEAIYINWVRQMSELITSSGIGADFWLNEIGYPDYRYRANQASKYGGDVYYAYEHTPAYQGVFLFKSFVMAERGPASLAAWYRIDDFPRTERRLGDDYVHYHLGVVDVAHQPKPAFRAFQFFNRLFAEAVRTVEPAAAPSKNSQAVVNVFRRQTGGFIVAAWLRSSEKGETSDRSGMAADRRAETLTVPLPCPTASQLRVYDVFGHTHESAAKLDRGELTHVPLRGSNVFVATVQCR